MGETRDVYVERAKAKLDEANAEIDKLKARADQASAEARAEYDEQIERLQEQRDQISRRLSELQSASRGAWEDLKTGLEISTEALMEAVRSARSRFR